MKFIVVCMCVLAAAGATADTLEQEMSSETFQKSGLHRLTEDELAYLNRYLGRTAAPKEQQFGKEQLSRKRAAPVDGPADELKTTVKGEFTGWKGKTVFRLANGQIWQQRVSGRYRFRAENPAVTIERGRFGYYLTIDETGRKVGVKRLK